MFPFTARRKGNENVNCHSVLYLQKWFILFSRSEKMTLNSSDNLRILFKSIKPIWNWDIDCDVKPFEEKNPRITYLFMDVD